MNPLAVEANEVIEAHAPAVMRVLSDLGRQLYYPKGILTQSAEAKQKAFRFDATIGEAREMKHAINLPAIMRHFCELDADQVLPYAPSFGRADLRAAWKAEIKEKNPSLGEAAISLPLVTCGITHGLSVVAEMFIDPGDIVLMPDQLWGNYLMVFAVRRGAKVVRYPLLDLDHGFDLAGFRRVLSENTGKGKVTVLFNFPNNPTGYSISSSEADAIKEILVEAAEGGCDVVALCDDAYFGLFYDDEAMRESFFTRLADAHPRLLGVKLDGASKEDFAWGLRVAFITYGISGGAGMYEALEKKTAGCIRGSISNVSNLSQQLILAAMADPEYRQQKRERGAVLERRAARAKAVLADPRFDKVWKLYPFNSGYFLTVRLNELDAEEYRLRLLNVHGVGTVSTSDTDIRVAISCVDEDDIADLFEVMLLCGEEMMSAGAAS